MAPPSSHGATSRIWQVDELSEAHLLTAFEQTVVGGLPRPILLITLDEVMKRVAPIAPERLLSLAEPMAGGAQRAIWLASLLPHLDG